MWARTALGVGDELVLRNAGTAANVRLVAERQRWLSESPAWLRDSSEGSTSVAVLRCEPLGLAGWTQMLTARPGQRCAGVMMPTGPNLARHTAAEHKLKGDGNEKELGDEPVLERLREFEAIATARARRLLQLLAAAPVLTLPVIRLVRKALLFDDLTPLATAEVLLGGLLQLHESPVVGSCEAVSPDLWQFTMAPEVREQLLRYADAVDSVTVFNAVTRLVEERWNQFMPRGSFRAFLTDPFKQAPPQLAGIEGFASVAGHVLEQLGGDYASLARALRDGQIKHLQDPWPSEEFQFEVNEYYEGFLGESVDSDQAQTFSIAKVLVVGDSGVGKTALTHRLATGAFQPSEASTVGAWCTQWPLPQPAAAAAPGDPQREVWLWDFGGQADQRLIHQLFLDHTDLVLIVFDASRDDVLDGLYGWQSVVRRTLATPPPQLLVAARVDAGFRASRARLEGFAAEQGMAFLETSARDGSGCEALQRAIHDAIAWDQLPRHTSPRLFQEIKREILRLRDQGEVLLTYKDLRERLGQCVLTPGLDDAALQTVLGLLDGPGVLKKLDYGDFVLLKPEWLAVYGQAVLRRLRQEEPQLGALPVGAIAAAALPFAEGQPRLEAPEEQVLLAELERQLQERRICLRQRGQLVFPSHCGRERPPSPALPPPFVSYAVRGWLDEIHATLVVSLAETRVFQLQDLWRDAAEFRSHATPQAASGRALAVQLQRHNVSEGTITLHMAAAVADAERVQFAQLIDGHLREAAETVERRRHWLCPHCHAPKGNGAVLMQKLARDGERARVVCDGCDRPFALYDNLERLFADTSLRREAEALGQQVLPERTARRDVLIQEVGARLTSANQKWQEINPDEEDGLDLQVEFTDDDGNGTGRYLFLQLKAGPSHLRRRTDGREMFAIKKSRWIRTWTQQPYPVMLVIGLPAPDEILASLIEENPHLKDEDVFREVNSMRGSIRRYLNTGHSESRTFPDVRWMEISSVLRSKLEAGLLPEQITQIEFTGEPLDLASVLRWRRRVLAEQSPSI